MVTTKFLPPARFFLLRLHICSYSCFLLQCLHLLVVITQVRCRVRSLCFLDLLLSPSLSAPPAEMGSI